MRIRRHCGLVLLLALIAAGAPHLHADTSDHECHGCANLHEAGDDDEGASLVHAAEPCARCRVQAPRGADAGPGAIIREAWAWRGRALPGALSLASSPTLLGVSPRAPPLVFYA